MRSINCSGSYLARWLDTALALAIILVAAPAICVAAVDEPEGYRMELYDDVVPEGLTGAVRVGAEQVLALKKTHGAVVIDVIPQHRRPEALPADQIWIPVPHKGVPDAVWLPDVGFGALSEVTEAYFKHHLAKATQGNQDHPVVFYCRTDCWMSWNAAKRALSYGYTDVYWFADGIDDWFFEGYEFALLQPAEGERHAGERAVK